MLQHHRCCDWCSGSITFDHIREDETQPLKGTSVDNRTSMNSESYRPQPSSKRVPSVVIQIIVTGTLDLSAATVLKAPQVIRVVQSCAWSSTDRVSPKN